MSKNTLKQDMKRLQGMNHEQQHAAWLELQQVPVKMAYSGVNAGHETIQERFYGWRKGTPRIYIEEWFVSRGACTKKLLFS